MIAKLSSSKRIIKLNNHEIIFLSVSPLILMLDSRVSLCFSLFLLTLANYKGKSSASAFATSFVAFTGLNWLIATYGHFLYLDLYSNEHYVKLFEFLTILVLFLKEKLEGSVFQFDAKHLLKVAAFCSAPIIWQFFETIRKITIFIQGWDHLGGHLYVTNQILNSGFARMFPSDYVSSAPKAFHSLAASFLVETQSGVQRILGLLDLEIYIFICLVISIVGSLRTKNTNSEWFYLVVVSSLISGPLIGWLIWMGYPTFALSIVCLITLVNLAEKARNSALFFLSAIATVQAWTLLLPIVLIIYANAILQGRYTTKYDRMAFALFFLLSTPPAISILKYNELNQFSEGSRFGGTLAHALFALNFILFISAQKSNVSKPSLSYAIRGTFLLALILFVLQFESELTIPYYSFKLLYLNVFLGLKLVRECGYPKFRVRQTKFMNSAFVLISIFVIMLPIPGAGQNVMQFLFGKNVNYDFVSQSIMKIDKDATKRNYLVYDTTGESSRASLFQGAMGYTRAIPASYLLTNNLEQICEYVENAVDLQILEKNTDNLLQQCENS